MEISFQRRKTKTNEKFARRSAMKEIPIKVILKLD
jgi:hypothetical protein